MDRDRQADHLGQDRRGRDQVRMTVRETLRATPSTSSAASGSMYGPFFVERDMLFSLPSPALSHRERVLIMASLSLWERVLG